MSQAELTEHQAKECLQAAGRSEDPLKREMPLSLCTGLDGGRDRGIEATGADQSGSPELSLADLPGIRAGEALQEKMS